MNDSDCVLCAGTALDGALMVEEVWRTDTWRLTTATVGELAGYSYLSPLRHVPHVTDLDGEEARSLGGVLAAATNAVKAATGADLVYVYVFGGGLDHLHMHLAPHREPGSPLQDDPIKGAKHQQTLSDGREVWVSDRYPLQDQGLMRAAVEGIRARLNPTASEPERSEDLG